MPPKRPSNEPENGTKISLGPLGTVSFRTIILVLIGSMHPLGRQVLGTFGFEFPDQRKLVEAAQQASAVSTSLGEIKSDVNTLKSDVAILKTDLALLKTDVSMVKAKQETLQTSVTGFQIDFDRFRRSSIEPATLPK